LCSGDPGLPNTLDACFLATAATDPDRAKLSQRCGAEDAVRDHERAPEHRGLELAVVNIGGLVGSSSCGGLVKISTKFRRA
jgi:hypothetical protein